MQRILASVIAVLIAAAIPTIQKSLNNYLMGFFRDIARVKARNRRMKSDAVISVADIRSIIMDGEEDPLQDIIDQIMSANGTGTGTGTGIGTDFNNDSSSSSSSNINDSSSASSGDLPIYSREELYEFGNGDDDVLLISIFGRVYDVSSSNKYYGKEGKYHLFAGRDSTRALATGCLQERCLGSKTSDGEVGSDKFETNERTMKEAKKWVAFFETHDKYSHVGFLKDGESIEFLIDAMLEQEIKEAALSEKK